MVLFKEKYFFYFREILSQFIKKNFLNKEAEIGLLMIKKLLNANKKGLLKNKSPFVHK